MFRRPGQVAAVLPGAWVYAGRVAFATAFFTAAACSNPVPDPPNLGDADIPPGDTTGADADLAPPVCSGAAPWLTLPARVQRFDDMIESAPHCLLFGIDGSGSELHVIDVTTDAVTVSITVGNGPSDLAMSADGSSLYVSVPGEKKIVEIDVASPAVIKTLTTTATPFRIAHGPARRVYFVEGTPFTAIHEIDARTEIERQVTSVTFREAELIASSDGTILYVGEAAQEDASLFQLDASVFDLAEIARFRFEGGFGQPDPIRSLTLSESLQRIYWAERAIDTLDLQRIHGWIGASVLTTSADGTMVATEDGLYDAQTFVRITDRAHPGMGVHFSSDSRFLYEYNPVGPLLYRTRVETLLGIHRLGATEVPAGSLSQRNFVQMVADPDPFRPVLYALDVQRNQMVTIDRNTLLPIRADIIGSAPTDMALHPDGNLLAVATFGATELVVLDLTPATKPLKRTLLVPGNPFRLALGPNNRVVYVEQDQLTDMQVVDAVSGALGETVTDVVYQPDVAFGPEGRFLYVGESATENARLFKVDMTVGPLDFDTAQVSPDGFSFPIRSVIYAGDAVYYAGSKISPDTLEVLGAFGDDIIRVTGDGRLALSRTRMYGTDCLCEVGGLPADSPLLAIDPAGDRVYQFDNATGSLFVQALP